MKHNLIALILALTLVSWAQTATQVTPSSPQQGTSADAKACPCCNKSASAKTKDSQSCCAHHAMSADSKEPACCAGKDKASCCDGKDGKSCERAGGNKTAATCCNAKKCDKNCEKGCCCSGKATEETASNCCARHGAGHSAAGMGE
jgi:hypothetical protein